MLNGAIKKKLDFTEKDFGLLRANLKPKKFQGSVRAFHLQPNTINDPFRPMGYPSQHRHILLSLSVHFFFLCCSLIYGQRGGFPVGNSLEKMCLYHSVNAVIERSRAWLCLNDGKGFLFVFFSAI